jgi:ABC-type Fe3+-hydroxamate transport system substrate-binding protein
MKPINVARLMNHRSGISQHYRRPIVKQVLEDYLKVVDSLTIYDNKVILQKQATKLAEEVVNNETEKMRKELEELKARQQVDIEQIKTQLANTNDQVSLLVQTLSNIKKYGAKSGTYAETDFVLQKLGVLTNGEIGQDPETGVTVEPV